MLTVLIVGSTATRTLAHGGATRAYTPRGYEADTKHGPDPQSRRSA